MKKKQLSIFAIGSLLLLGIVFTGCLKDKDNNNSNTEVAGLMAFNLAPDRTVGFAISGNLLTNSPLLFNSYTGVYLPIYPGTRSVESFDYPQGATIATASTDFAAKKFYSVFLVGADSSYQNVIVNDNFDSLSASSGQSYIRYINGIVGTTSPNVTIAAGGTNVVNANAAFASVSEFVAVAPGSVTITVSEGSSLNVNRTITTEAKKVYTVLLASGATASEPAQIKYITNGTLEDEASGQRVSSSSTILTSK